MGLCNGRGQGSTVSSCLPGLAAAGSPLLSASAPHQVRDGSPPSWRSLCSHVHLKGAGTASRAPAQPPPGGWRHPSCLALLCPPSPLPSGPSEWAPPACQRPLPTTKLLSASKGEDPPSWLPPQGCSPEMRLGQWVQKGLQRRLGSRGHGNSRHAGISPHTCAPSRRSGRRGRACQGRPRGCGGLLRPRERLRPLLQLQSQQHSVFQALGPQLPASSPEDPVVTLGDSSPTSEPLFPPRPGAPTENSDMGRLCALFSDPRTQKAQCCPPADALQLVGVCFARCEGHTHGPRAGEAEAGGQGRKMAVQSQPGLLSEP